MHACMYECMHACVNACMHVFFFLAALDRLQRPRNLATSPRRNSTGTRTSQKKKSHSMAVKEPYYDGKRALLWL